MTHSDATSSGTKEQGRRARVVILGEFSAGKSTLINLLTGGNNLRTQVTATQMPPVWMSLGSDEPYRVDLDGQEHPVNPGDPESISVSETLYVRKFMQAPLLEMFDLIDTPGNSDPNIASAAWERAAEIADIAIWCSGSTQAWRQSELAAWRDLPESLRARSILLLTRADKLTSDADREKVLNRVKREAGDFFTHIHMASLLKLENTRDVLADLVAMVDSLGAADQTIIAASSQGTSELSKLLPTDTSAQQVELMPKDSAQLNSDDQNRPTNSDEELTDDMLIDSLDLSDDTGLDELVFNEDEDADMDEVLAALTGAAPLVNQGMRATSTAKPDVSPKSAKKSEQPLETVLSTSSSKTVPAEGYASELWRTMSETVPSDDPDAYEAAFDMFLEKIDLEVSTLRGQLNMKATG